MATRFNFLKVPTIDLATQLAFYEAAFGFARYADFDGDDLEEILMKQEGSEFLLVLMRFKHATPSGATRAQLLSDPHSPDEYRVNGIVRNFDPWYKAFNVKPGDKLYLAPADRVHVW